MLGNMAAQVTYSQVRAVLVEEKCGMYFTAMDKETGSSLVYIMKAKNTSDQN